MANNYPSLKKCYLLILAFFIVIYGFGQDHDSATKAENLDTNHATVDGDTSKLRDTGTVANKNKPTDNRQKQQNDADTNQQSGSHGIRDSLYNDLEHQKKYPELIYKHKAKDYTFSLLGAFVLIWGIGIILLYHTNICKDESFDPDTNLLRPLRERTFSYSRVQLWWWTCIILSCFLTTLFYSGFLVAFTPTMIILLGGGLATTIAGKIIDDGQIESNNLPNTQNPNQLPVPKRHQDLQPTKGFWIDILSDESGITIHRFQAVAFNLIFGFGFITFFISQIKAQLFPFIDFSDWQLVLLGVSTAGYLGFKTNENSQATKLEREVEVVNSAKPPQNPPSGENLIPENTPTAISPIQKLRNRLVESGVIK